LANRQKFNTQHNWDSEIARSENYHLSPMIRSGIRHDLIDEAIVLHDDEFWLKVGRVLMKAAHENDLSPQVSDRFVNNAPDDVFTKIVCENTHQPPFKAWRKRGIELLGDRYPRHKHQK